jgi:predicted choloylglycine hydrolase
VRKKLSVDIVELKGSNYQVGLEQSKKIKLGENYRMLKFLSENVDSEKAQTIITEFSVGLLDEIRGIADGLKIDIKQAIRMYSGYDLTFPSMGCSAFSQGNYYVRNYDFSPEWYDGQLVFTNPENGYASIGFSQQIIGRLDGMNNQGLVVGLHLVNEKSMGTGLLGTTIVRLILDECKDVGEAINLINELPHLNCYNYSLIDMNGNKCLIEASPERQIVNYQSTLLCTNHFESELLRKNNRSYIEGSLNRKKILQDLASETTSPEEAYKKFNKEDSPLFFKEYRQFFGTLHTVVYLPQTLEVLVGIGGDAVPAKFSFVKWLNGEQLVGDKLIGELDY